MTSHKTPRDGNGSKIKEITRRSFLRVFQCAGFGALLGWKHVKNTSWTATQQGVAGEVTAQPFSPSLAGKLVHVYDSRATSWNFSSGWFGDYVDQYIVDAMVEQGLLQLTGARTIPAAWKRLVPSYVPGRTFAIKVNFNNYDYTGPDPDPEINAIIEPVNGLIRTLVLCGVQPSEISVYDVTNSWHSGAMPPSSFVARCLYPGVNFIYHYQNSNPFSSTEKVTFNPTGTPTIPDLAIGNVVVDADYLINMFVPKGHRLCGVTLGFKNHLGSVNKCEEVHDYFPYSYYYDPGYSPMLDIFRNPHFGAKTVLTICDGLFGQWEGVHGEPRRWVTFNNGAPNSLFFSADPVAIDSVLADFIEEETIQQGSGSLMNGTRDYLALAEAEKFGIYDHADPWILPIGSDYSKLSYIYVNGV